MDSFSLAAVGKSAGVWNAEKLEWVNSQWLRGKSNEELATILAPRIEAAGFPAQADDDVLACRIGTLTERAKTLVDLIDSGAWYWVAADAIEYNDEKAKRKFLNGATAPLLEAALGALDALDESSWNEEAIEGALSAVLERFEVGVGKLAQPLRVAITGTTRSPGIYVSLQALGRAKTLVRIQRALDVAAAAPAPEA